MQDGNAEPKAERSGRGRNKLARSAALLEKLNLQPNNLFQ